MMRNHGWVLGILWIWGSSPVHAANCRAPQGRALVIGHTHGLNWVTTFRLQNSARLLGHKVRFQDLRGKDPATALDGVDALVVPGGADIDPQFYDLADLPAPYKAKVAQYRRYYIGTSEGRNRDPFEYAVYRDYFTDPANAGLPALGICRGMQMMAVAQGVPLVQDLKAELNIKNRRHRFDRFRVTDATGVLGDLFPRGTDIGWKNHHQNPRADYLAAHPERHPNLRITATSNGGRVVEGIEFSDRPALGVQFHPESSFPRLKHRVFSWLLNAACERSHQGETAP
jgi:putative glutamine amidotransferase